MPCRHENFRARAREAGDADDERRRRFGHGDRLRPREIVVAVEFRSSARTRVHRPHRDAMREDSPSTARRRAAGRGFPGDSVRGRGFGTLGHFGFLEPRRAINDPTTNSDSQKENCVKFENANDAHILQGPFSERSAPPHGSRQFNCVAPDDVHAGATSRSAMRSTSICKVEDRQILVEDGLMAASLASSFPACPTMRGPKPTNDLSG